ncbi:GIY-YIG nuclease family protein [Aggregatibacter actinomycetemcomitans]|uniref:GIY-YIG nuclease family protein n=1 Tax=Aggregatibacter actinomycetemcomitans TaxID=714 RepID=UPI003B9810DE
MGMTRRLEPLDRIRELGDASVPFSFDVHALIYSENAPALENELHKVFADHQVNRVNPRKEFFKVPLDMIADEVKKRNAKIEFTMLAEASEYYQSLAMEKEHKYTDIIESDDEDLSEE